MILNTIDRMPRAIKRLIVMAYDIVAMCFALLAAFWIRLGWDSVDFTASQLGIFAGSIATAFLMFTTLGVYRAVMRFVSFKQMIDLLLGICVAAVLLEVLSEGFDSLMPRSVPFLFLTFSLFLLGMPRILMRLSSMQQTTAIKENVVIYGAGSAGRQLITALSIGRDYNPVAIIDEKTSYYHSTIWGLKVYPIRKLHDLKKQYGSLKVLVAIEDATYDRQRELLSTLEPYAVELLQIPSMSEIVSGRRKIDQLQEVRVEQLLGREPVKPLEGLMEANILNKVVMVTGAGGSIGSELCRQIVAEQPKTLLLFELSEFGLYQIEHELRRNFEQLGQEVHIVALMGSVQDGMLVRRIIREFGVQTIYHAAAYKHVPMVEHNVIAGIRNNVFGTAEVAKAAIEEDVETFVLISTDKAVRPTNIMGATKRLAELVLQGLSEQSENTRFVMVRFGNVLGSSGSVVPLFKRQIQSGGPITVTHPEITRYFMTIPEAVQLVIQAGTMGEGGDVFVLDMGEPIKIVDLAKKMTHLMGHQIKDEQYPNGDIAIEYSGLRPGEKLFEELLIGDNVTKTAHKRVMRAIESKLSLDEILILLDELNYAMSNLNLSEIRQLLVDAPLGYTPDKQISDSLWSRTESERIKQIALAEACAKAS